MGPLVCSEFLGIGDGNFTRSVSNAGSSLPTLLARSFWCFTMDRHSVFVLAARS